VTVPQHVSEVLVDARGRPCPVPIIELAKAVRASAPGQVLELWATDRAVEADLRAWCEGSGHELLSQQEREGTYRARVRVRGVGRQGPGPSE
jgi:tRNA 2-thiouridine synthesizing protein A